MIEDETLELAEHMEQALRVNLDESVSSVAVPAFTMVAVRRYTSGSLKELQSSRKARIEGWRGVGASLSHDPSEPSHTSLIEAMTTSLTCWTVGQLVSPPPYKLSASHAIARTPRGGPLRPALPPSP